MAVEYVFCPTCLEVTPCTIERDVDRITWTCIECGKMADEEWIGDDDYSHYED